MTLQGQIDLLSDAVSQNGLLTPERNNYTINKCYDIYNNFIGVELKSKNQEQPLMKAPEGTIRKENIGQDIQPTLEKIDFMPEMPKLRLYMDATGALREGTEPLKPTIIKGLDGELKFGSGIAKEAAEQVGKAAFKDYVR